MHGSAIRDVLLWTVGLGRYAKRSLLVINDLAVLGLALWIAFTVRYGVAFVPPTTAFTALMVAAPVISVVTFFQLGIYRMVTRFMGGRAINRIALGMSLSVLIWALLVFLSGLQGVPRLTVFIYAIIGTAGIWMTRQVAGWLLKAVGVPIPPNGEERNRLPVLIYGAGAAGIQLASALERSDRYVPIGLHRSQSDALGPVRRRLQGLSPGAPAGAGRTP